jgi:transcriptional regulator with XRE-family HTH domain
MTSQNGRAFNEWLRAQLKAKKMSQRQLAQQSGVDHSTISRLIRGDRMPSLGTATKLARGLRELRDDADTPQYLGLVAAGASNPTARVEYALRADELLTEAQVRQIMEYYLAVRMRRFGRAFQPSEPTDRSPDRPTSHGQAGHAPVGHTQAGNGPTAMTPRLGTAGTMTGTIRPMAATVRQMPTARPMSGSARPMSGAARPMSGAARPMTQPPRVAGRPVGREPGRY